MRFRYGDYVQLEYRSAIVADDYGVVIAGDEDCQKPDGRKYKVVFENGKIESVFFTHMKLVEHLTVEQLLTHPSNEVRDAALKLGDKLGKRIRKFKPQWVS